MGLAADDRPGLPRSLDCAVGGVVVIDVDRGVRQRRAEIGHNLADRGFLVVAGHQHRNPAQADNLG
jgi:hypothetical protein